MLPASCKLQAHNLLKSHLCCIGDEGVPDLFPLLPGQWENQVELASEAGSKLLLMVLSLKETSPASFTRT